MLYFRNCLIGLLSLFAFSQFRPVGKHNLLANSPAPFNRYHLLPDTGRVIVITKIEKPWAASHKLVVNKFIESVPQYQQLPGLLFKAYAFSESGSYFGGIYLWQSKEAAEKWFSPIWHESVKQKYKTTAEVIEYGVTAVENVAAIADIQGKYWSVVSMGDDKINKDSKGLIKIIFIKDSKGSIGHVSFWKSEKEARDYFQKNLSANEFFDTPLLLNNESK